MKFTIKDQSKNSRDIEWSLALDHVGNVDIIANGFTVVVIDIQNRGLLRRISGLDTLDGLEELETDSHGRLLVDPL